jgi:hypothetical protein
MRGCSLPSSPTFGQLRAAQFSQERRAWALRRGCRGRLVEQHSLGAGRPAFELPLALDDREDPELLVQRVGGLHGSVQKRSDGVLVDGA